MARETAVFPRSQARFNAYQLNSDIQGIPRAITGTRHIRTLSQQHRLCGSSPCTLMRLRSVRSWPENQRWAEALALFSVVAPLLLLAAYVLEVVIPYQLPQAGESHFPLVARAIALHPQVGGLSLLTMPGFDIALGCQVVIAALVLLGLRWKLAVTPAQQRWRPDREPHALSHGRAVPAALAVRCAAILFTITPRRTRALA